MYVLVLLLFVAAALTISGGVAWREQALTPAASEFLKFVASIVRRGYPLGNAIRVYASEKSSIHQFGARDELLDLADNLDAGESLADSLDAHPYHFPPYTAALARAGERGGNLDRILDRLTGSAETDRALTQRSAGYITYAMMTAINGFVLMSFVATVMMPQMERMFCDLGTPPRGWFWGWFPYAPLVALVIFVVTLAITVVSVPYVPWKARLAWMRWLRRRRDRGLYRRAALWAMWYMPVIGRCVRRRAISRFSYVAAELLRAGVPVDETLTLAARASGNRYMEAIGTDAAERARGGESFRAALAGADGRGHLPADFMWYVETGERSSDFGGAIERAAETSAVRSRFALGLLVRALAPASIIVLGLVTGLVGFALFDGLLRIMEMLSV